MVETKSDAEMRNTIAEYTHQVRRGYLRKSDIDNFATWIEQKWARHQVTYHTLNQSVRMLPYLRKYVK
jgi:hypothetical protein